MAYQVIARKYRPQRFADVVGQDHVTTTLSNAIQQNRIAHAYLFVGPRGTGKTTIARIFAKCLNCTDGPSPDYKDDDSRCIEITEGRSLDVLEIDGASNRGIDEIRELRDTARYAPTSCRFKIYIIDEVHMLTKEAFNALLKTLEEPPEHVKFMFATTEPEKILPTILSRCQRYDLRRIPAPLIIEHLNMIAGKEGVEVEEDALKAVARGCEGCMRDAESILDQLISFCGKKITETDVLGMFGLTSRTQIMDLIRALLNQDPQEVLHIIEDLHAAGKDTTRLLSDLIAELRDVWVIRIQATHTKSREQGPQTSPPLYDDFFSGFDPECFRRMMEILTVCESRLRLVISKRILLETSLIHAMESVNSVPIDKVLQTLNDLKDNLEDESGGVKNQSTVSRQPQPTQRSRKAPEKVPSQPISTKNEEPATPEPPSNPAPATLSPPKEKPLQKKSTGQTAEQLWPEVISAIAKSNPFIRSYLDKAIPLDTVNHVLRIGFRSEDSDFIGLVDNKKTHTLLADKFKEAGASDLKFRFVIENSDIPESPKPKLPSQEPLPETSPTLLEKPASPPQSAEPSPPTPDPTPQVIDEKAFKEDPLIQEALKVFRGSLIEIHGPRES